MTVKTPWFNNLGRHAAQGDDRQLAGLNAQRDVLNQIASGSFFCDLSNLAWIRATGSDVESFLQSQFSNDLAALDANHSQLNAYCDPKGRMLCISRVMRVETGFLLQLPASLVTEIRDRLARYVLRAKVVLEPASELVGLGICGDPVVESLSDLLIFPDTQDGYCLNGEVSTLGLPGPWPRYQMIGPIDSMQLIWERLADGGPLVGSWAWSWVDIRAGLPQIVPQTAAMFIPQMANLDLLGGISFDKGCYPGQEIVARTRYRGKLKQRMVLAHVNTATPPEPGDKLYAPDHGEQSAGTVVDAQPQAPERFDLLAVLRLTSYRNNDVHLNSPDGPLLRFEPLPYPVPSDDQ